MEGAVELEKKVGRNRQLTERDRELCGFLAVCRYLSREQVERLMFPGRSKARSSTRLRQLAASMGGQAAVLRGDLGFGSADGWTTIWALTAEGFEVGARQVGLQVERVPKHDVGQAFLKHEMMLNEVFLGLVPQDGKTPAKVPRGFRWILGEYLDLPFQDFAAVGNGMERRRLQPDAMLEDPKGKQRYFIEYETGSATVLDAKKSTSTLAKIDRYGTFYRAPAGNVFARGRETGYSSAFKDGWPAEVLFVTASEARRDSINGAIRERHRSDKYKMDARALTLPEAQRFLCRTVYSADRPPAIARRSGRTPQPLSLPLPTDGAGHSPARSAADERLRRGRVAVRGEALVKLEKSMVSLLTALRSAQDALGRLKVSPDAIPEVPASTLSVLRVLAEYSHRGAEALARYGLRQAE
jgi:Replication-relaxation